MEIYAVVESITLVGGDVMQFAVPARVLGIAGDDGRHVVIEASDGGGLWGRNESLGDVRSIRAIKGAGHACTTKCARAGHRYQHDFGDGIRIRAKDGVFILEGDNDLWDWFDVGRATRWKGD